MQWQVLQAERDAAAAHVKTLELGLAGVVADSEVPLPLTRPESYQPGESEGGRGRARQVGLRQGPLWPGLRLGPGESE